MKYIIIYSNQLEVEVYPGCNTYFRIISTKEELDIALIQNIDPVVLFVPILLAYKLKVEYGWVHIFADSNEFEKNQNQIEGLNWKKVNHPPLKGRA